MSTTIKEQLIKEIEELPSDAQEKILKLVHFIREEIFMPERVKSKEINDFPKLTKAIFVGGVRNPYFVL